MNPQWITLLVVLPMLAGVVTLLLTGRRIAQTAATLTSAGLTTALATLMLRHVMTREPYLVAQMGGWPAPFGITIVLDAMSGLMVLCASLVFLAVALMVADRIGPRHPRLLHPLMHFLMLGVYWSFLTGDLFNLFVAFEIMLMASYVLLVAGTSRQQMSHAYKYVLLNLVGSTLFVTCAGLIYAATGTLNMADLARMAHGGMFPSSALAPAALLVVVFGLKSAVFPLWFWLPDSYPTIPPPIAALFGGLLTKVGAYVTLRVMVMVLGAPEQPLAQILAPLLIVSASITMFVGVLGAVSRHTVRGILSVHVISQVGYMLMGAGLAMSADLPPAARGLAAAGCVFFIVHNMIVKSALFCCGAAMQHHAGCDDLARIGGLVRHAPWLAALFLISAASLAGLPPSSGFFGKWVLLRESIGGGYFVLATFAVLTSVLTTLSMLKIWCGGFWAQPAGLQARGQAPQRAIPLAMAGITLLVAAALTIGLGAQGMMRICTQAGMAVADPSGYIRAVLPMHGAAGGAAGSTNGPASAIHVTTHPDGLAPGVALDRAAPAASVDGASTVSATATPASSDATDLALATPTRSPPAAEVSP